MAVSGVCACVRHAVCPSVPMSFSLSGPLRQVHSPARHTRVLRYHNKREERRGLLACIDKSAGGGGAGGKMNIYIKVVSPSPVQARQDEVEQPQKKRL